MADLWPGRAVGGSGQVMARKWDDVRLLQTEEGELWLRYDMLKFEPNLEM